MDDLFRQNSSVKVNKRAECSSRLLTIKQLSRKVQKETLLVRCKTWNCNRRRWRSRITWHKISCHDQNKLPTLSTWLLVNWEKRREKTSFNLAFYLPWLTVVFILVLFTKKHLTCLTTVFGDTRLWKTKHSRKRFQNFRQSYVLSTCRIEIHQSQPASMT